MTETEKLYNLLSSYGYPVKSLGYLLGSEGVPSRFIVYTERTTKDGRNYDNKCNSIVFEWQIVYYTDSLADAEEFAYTLKADLKKEGYYMKGIGNVISGTIGAIDTVGRSMYISSSRKI